MDSVTTISTAIEMLNSHALDCSAVLGGGRVDCFTFTYGDRETPCVRFTVPKEVELLLLASGGYPAVPPILLVTVQASQTIQKDLEWNLSLPAEERLLHALQKWFQAPPPYTIKYGPSIDLLMTADAGKAKIAGWPQYFSGKSENSEVIQKSLFSRSSGILSNLLSEKKVMIVGLGSGGSYVAECLARSGLGKFILIDGDIVEAENLARTTYYVGDIGSKKVDAIARHLININPLIDIQKFDHELSHIGHTTLAELFQSIDLLVALTDDPYAQSRMNHYSYFYAKPALFAALYRGAQGGEIIICIPGETPCLECATGRVREKLSRPTADVNYGTGRLSGEPAIIADIHHLDSATVKLSLSLLLRGQEGLLVPKFIETALSNKFTYLCMSMVPEYWVFPQVFADTPGQHGYQSMWLTVEGTNDCPFCGPDGERENPAHFPLSPSRII